MRTGERNPWHSVWCQVLAVVARLLDTLGHNTEFNVQATNFVSIHSQRLADALTLPQQQQTSSLLLSSQEFGQEAVPEKTKSSAAELEEARWSACLLHNLCRHASAWGLAPPDFEGMVQRLLAMVVHRFAMLLVSQPSGGADAEVFVPISKAEMIEKSKRIDRYLPLRAAISPKSGATATSVTQATPLSKASAAAAGVPVVQPAAEVTEFDEKIEGLLCCLLREVFAGLRLLLPAIQSTRPDDLIAALPSFRPAFELGLAMNSPKLGVLLICNTAFGTATRSPSSPSHLRSLLLECANMIFVHLALGFASILRAGAGQDVQWQAHKSALIETSQDFLRMLDKLIRENHPEKSFLQGIRDALLRIVKRN
jgi:hypothetical protein